MLRAAEAHRPRLAVAPIGRAGSRDRSDTGVSQNADFDGATADRPARAASRPRNSLRTPQDRCETPVPDAAGAPVLPGSAPRCPGRCHAPGAQTVRPTIAIAPVRTGHVIGRAITVPRTAVAPGMARHPLATVEDLDGACGGAGVDLFTDQRRHRSRRTSTSTW